MNERPWLYAYGPTCLLLAGALATAVSLSTCSIVGSDTLTIVDQLFLKPFPPVIAMRLESPVSESSGERIVQQWALTRDQAQLSSTPFRNTLMRPHSPAERHETKPPNAGGPFSPPRGSHAAVRDIPKE